MATDSQKVKNGTRFPGTPRKKKSDWKMAQKFLLHGKVKLLGLSCPHHELLDIL